MISLSRGLKISSELEISLLRDLKISSELEMCEIYLLYVKYGIAVQLVPYVIKKT